jgi:hypothetical protein
LRVFRKRDEVLIFPGVCGRMLFIVQSSSSASQL